MYSLTRTRYAHKIYQKYHKSSLLVHNECPNYDNPKSKYNLNCPANAHLKCPANTHFKCPANTHLKCPANAQQISYDLKCPANAQLV